MYERLMQTIRPANQRCTKNKNIKITLTHTEKKKDSNPGFYPDALGLGEIADIGGNCWGLCPQRGPEAERLVRGSEGGETNRS